MESQIIVKLSEPRNIPPTPNSDLNPRFSEADLFLALATRRREFPELHVRHWQGRAEQQRSGEWDKVKEIIAQWKSPGGMFILVGTRGTGKTQIAVDAGCDRLWRVKDTPDSYGHAEKYFPRYTTAVKLFSTLRSAMRPDSPASEEKVFTGYAQPKFLVIDDVHERGNTEFEDRMLTRLIDERYAATLGTIIIANTKPDDISKAVGPSIVSRVKESGELLVCNWPSFRGAK